MILTFGLITQILIVQKRENPSQSITPLYNSTTMNPTFVMVQILFRDFEGLWGSVAVDCIILIQQWHALTFTDKQALQASHGV